MQIKVTRRGELQSSHWSGGTTTQLAIFPTDADYAARNFTWRVSSARVDVLESVFTSLPGVKRTLMVLDGRLALTHEGHHGSNLGVFEQDSFLGDWTTRSLGRVTDFNVMTRGCESSLEVLSLSAVKDAVSPSGPPVCAAYGSAAGDCALTSDTAGANSPVGVASGYCRLSDEGSAEVVLERREGFSRASMVLYFVPVGGVSNAADVTCCSGNSAICGLPAAFGVAAIPAAESGAAPPTCAVEISDAESGVASPACTVEVSAAEFFVKCGAGDVLTVTLDVGAAPLHVALRGPDADFKVVAARIFHD